MPSLLIQLILEFLAEFHLIKQAWSESPGWTLILTPPPTHPVKCKWSLDAHENLLVSHGIVLAEFRRDHQGALSNDAMENLVFS